MRLAVAALAALLGVGLVPASASGLPTSHPAANPTPTASSSSTSGSTPVHKPAHTVTFGAGPAGPKIVKGKVVKRHGKVEYVVDGRPYFGYGVEPGSSQIDHIAILNFARKPQRLAVYTVDATSAANGDFAYQPKAAPRRQGGAWMSVGTPHASGYVTVAPRSRIILPVRIHVPVNAQPGDHGAAVIVSLTGLVTAKGKRVNFEQRVATRAILRVQGTLNPQLSVENLHASYNGKTSPLAKGSATVTYDVVNTGNALLGAAQAVTVTGLFGSSATVSKIPSVPLILPGARYPVTVHVPGVFPEILETAKVKLVPAGLQGDVNPGVHVETASVHFWAIPWLLLLIILLVVAYIVFRVIRRRRRKKLSIRPGDVAPEGSKS